MTPRAAFATALRWLRRERIPITPPKPPIIAVIYAPPDISAQRDRTDASIKSVRRVCLKMQQQQYALNGWNYARQFRS